MAQTISQFRGVTNANGNCCPPLTAPRSANLVFLWAAVYAVSAPQSPIFPLMPVFILADFPEPSSPRAARPLLLD